MASLFSIHKIFFLQYDERMSKRKRSKQRNRTTPPFLLLFWFALTWAFLRLIFFSNVCSSFVFSCPRDACSYHLSTFVSSGCSFHYGFSEDLCILRILTCYLLYDPLLIKIVSHNIGEKCVAQGHQNAIIRAGWGHSPRFPAQGFFPCPRHSLDPWGKFSGNC